LESLKDELELKKMTLKANEDALKRKVESEMYTIDAERKKLRDHEIKLKRREGALGGGNKSVLEIEKQEKETPKKKF